MRFLHHNTRLATPGVLFCVLVLAIGSAAESAKSRSTFNLDLPNQTLDRSLRGPNGIEYLSPNQIAVWYTDKTGGQLSRRDKLQKDDPWQLKLQIVDLAHGTVTQNLEWPTRKDSTDLAVQNGHAVLLTGPLVQCFTPDFKQTGAMRLEHASKPQGSALLRTSPGGQKAWTIEVSDVVTATQVDPKTCASGWSAFANRSAATLSGNDDLLVDTTMTQVTLSSPANVRSPLFQHSCCLSHARFVAPDLVGLVQLDLDLRRHFLLVNLQGQLLLNDALDPGYEFGDIVTAADGRSAALIVVQRDFRYTSTGVEVRRIQALIRLYDLVAHKRRAELNLSIPGENLFGLAISPDSTQFAVLNGTRLTMYELPQQHTGR